MICRPATVEDLPAIEALVREYPYPNLRSPSIEALYVVVNAEGRIIMACAAERIVQLYLYAGESSPATKLQALSLLHGLLPKPLRSKGYAEANVFLPPQIETKFARRLMRSFGWARNWASLYLKF